jgi:hypothetical protein
MNSGGRAKIISPESMLRRSVLSCLLWEKEFYEDGKTIASRILELASVCSPKFVYDLAMEARHLLGLRHVPLLLLLNLVQRRDIKDAVIFVAEDKIGDGGRPQNFSVKHAIANVIRRPDEMMELVAMYWLTKKAVGNKIPQKMSDRQLRDGLALAFGKFNEYSLAKYDRDGAVRLRDVMFLAHPKPKNEEQAALYKRVANKGLKTPDTWEVELSAGKDKKETFERLLKEEKLGYLALLRNLRNMDGAGCDFGLVSDTILARKGAELVFPFRYVAAARAAPRFEKVLDEALQATVKAGKPLSGTTLVYVDCSGSMRHTPVSARSDIDRVTAAATLASVLNGDNIRIFSFANRVLELPHRQGMAGVEKIVNSQNGGTNLVGAVEHANGLKHDRLIFVTDEQDTTGRKIPDPVCPLAYMINVASNKNGVGYGRWIHLDGFSEGIIRYILEIEKTLYTSQIGEKK